MNVVTSGSGSSEALRIFPKPIDKMEKSEERVPVGHAGAGISHNSFDLLPHVRPVTMHRAVGTSRLGLPEWTSAKALVGIRFQDLTLVA